MAFRMCRRTEPAYEEKACKSPVASVPSSPKASLPELQSKTESELDDSAALWKRTWEGERLAFLCHVLSSLDKKRARR